jgi:CRP-like cAMP-binding protein
MSIELLLEIMLGNGHPPRKVMTANFKKELTDDLAPFITRHSYRKSQILLSKGHICNHLYFLKEGIVRGYYQLSESGKEQTHFLWNGNSMITDTLSFYKRRPSKLTIETLTEVKLESISFEHLMVCKKKQPLLEHFNQNLILQYHEYEKRRNYDLVALTPWERYLRLLETHPRAEQFISKEIIASFLNITPQTLSRLLRERGHP